VAFFAAGSKTRAHLESVSDLQVLVHRLQYKHHQQHKLQQPQSQKQQLHLLLSHKEATDQQDCHPHLNYSQAGLLQQQKE